MTFLRLADQADAQSLADAVERSLARDRDDNRASRLKLRQCKFASPLRVEALSLRVTVVGCGGFVSRRSRYVVTLSDVDCLCLRSVPPLTLSRLPSWCGRRSLCWATAGMANVRIPPPADDGERRQVDRSRWRGVHQPAPVVRVVLTSARPSAGRRTETGDQPFMARSNCALVIRERPRMLRRFASA
jgi:hypothetical protein